MPLAPDVLAAVNAPHSKCRSSPEVRPQCSTFYATPCQRRYRMRSVTLLTLCPAAQTHGRPIYNGSCQEVTTFGNY